MKEIQLWRSYRIKDVVGRHIHPGMQLVSVGGTDSSSVWGGSQVSKAYLPPLSFQYQDAEPLGSVDPLGALDGRAELPGCSGDYRRRRPATASQVSTTPCRNSACHDSAHSSKPTATGMVLRLEPGLAPTGVDVLTVTDSLGESTPDVHGDVGATANNARAELAAQVCHY